VNEPVNRRSLEVGRRVPHPRLDRWRRVLDVAVRVEHPDDRAGALEDRSVAKIGFRRGQTESRSLGRVSHSSGQHRRGFVTSDDVARSRRERAVGAVWVCAVDAVSTVCTVGVVAIEDGHDRPVVGSGGETLEKRSARFRSSVVGRDERADETVHLAVGESLTGPSSVRSLSSEAPSNRAASVSIASSAAAESPTTRTQGASPTTVAVPSLTQQSPPVWPDSGLAPRVGTVRSDRHLLGESSDDRVPNERVSDDREHEPSKQPRKGPQYRPDHSPTR